MESFFVVVLAAVLLGAGLWALAAIRQLHAAVDLGNEEED